MQLILRAMSEEQNNVERNKKKVSFPSIKMTVWTTLYIYTH